jgi:hypothetical protein
MFMTHIIHHGGFIMLIKANNRVQALILNTNYLLKVCKIDRISALFLVLLGSKIVTGY